MEGSSGGRRTAQEVGRQGVREDLAKGVLSAAAIKREMVEFRARQADCKITGALHQVFDWGVALACKKENVEVWLTTPPGDPTQFRGLQLRPPRDAPKRCE